MKCSCHARRGRTREHTHTAKIQHRTELFRICSMTRGTYAVLIHPFRRNTGHAHPPWAFQGNKEHADPFRAAKPFPRLIFGSSYCHVGEKFSYLFRMRRFTCSFFNKNIFLMLLDNREFLILLNTCFPREQAIYQVYGSM